MRFKYEDRTEHWRTLYKEPVNIYTQPMWHVSKIEDSLFLALPKTLTMIDQVCLIKVGAKLCRTLALLFDTPVISLGYFCVHQTYHWSLGPKSSRRLTSLHKTFSTDQKINWLYLCSSWSRVRQDETAFLVNVILILCIEMLFPPFIRLFCKSLAVNVCFFPPLLWSNNVFPLILYKSVYSTQSMVLYGTM